MQVYLLSRFIDLRGKLSKRALDSFVLDEESQNL
jgi:hypothetical protein